MLPRTSQPPIAGSRPRPRPAATRLFRILPLATCLGLPATLAAQQTAGGDYRSDWALADGFIIRRDAQGFRFPTSIAFVPRPGPGPKDPLYFVAELGGTIKVVTNDRTVSDFAVGVMPKPTQDTLPAYEGEVGLAGLCLEPRHGYVFATFAYADSTGVLRNGLARFETGSSRFALTPTSKALYTDLFLQDVSAISHQIGPCQATRTALFVSVGDGEDQKASRSLGSTLGKILRLTLDGAPAPGNPFARGGAERTAASVWAYGLRNPFGLKVIGTRVLVADNGNDLDRFLEIQPGTDYGWDGTDLSIGMNAAMVFGPAVSPVQMDYCGPGAAGLPAGWADRFFVALSGTPRLTGAEDRHGKGVYALHYGLRERRMLDVPKYLMQYRGDGYQSVVGLGCGPDAVYVVPIFPDRTGVTAVLAVTYDPATVYPYGLAADTKPIRLMQDMGCFGCHALEGKGGTAGPSLDRDSLVARLTARLSSEEYRRSIDSVDALPAEPFVSSRKARHDVLALEGMDRIQLWMRYHILQPKFDNPRSQMPALDLSEAQAVALTDFLLAEPPTPTPKPRRARRRLALAFVVGVVIGGAGSAAVVWWRRR
jgi:Glucose / Sorbosone dehydrogenase